jgi:hypothetical protein
MTIEIPPKQWRANVSHKHKFVWTAPAKAATRTTKNVFRKHCELNPEWPTEDHPSDFTHVNRWPAGVSNDYLHITSVRHPYYRWISYWKYAQRGANELKRLGTDPLTAILEMPRAAEGWFTAWSCYYMSVRTNPRIDYIIRAESLVDDIRKLPFMPDDYELDVSSDGRTRPLLGIDWDEQELRDVVYDLFRVDYDNFGYGKNDVFNLWDSNPRLI